MRVHGQALTELFLKESYNLGCKILTAAHFSLQRENVDVFHPIRSRKLIQEVDILEQDSLQNSYIAEICVWYKCLKYI